MLYPHRAKRRMTWTHRPTGLRRTALVLSGLFLLAGCNLAPKYVTPETQTPPAFKEQAPEPTQAGSGWKAAAPSDGMIRTKWWEMFHDAGLDALESQVATANQNVAAALGNFLAARALVKQARSNYFPVVGVAPSVTRGRALLTPTSPGLAGTPVTVTEFSLPIDASWEADVWGRVRNTVNANALEAQATLADLGNVRLTVQAELAVDYFQLRALDAQKKLLDETVLAYQDSLKLTQVQFDTGLASGQDVAQSATLLDTTLAQATDLGIQRAQFEHAIATLIGQPASTFSLAGPATTAAPVAIPAGVPSQLLERRPDIAAAERRVAEANAQIGVARAAYFPALTLNGSAGYQSTDSGTLISGPSFIWSVGAGLAQSLFDGGYRKAVTEQARAKYQITVANYRQTVLAAFQDVEDNLSALRILTVELRQQDGAVASSQQYLDLALGRYTSGMDSYLNVVTAQTLLLSNQRVALNLRMAQMTASVQLIKALGGGWEGASDPVSAKQSGPPANPPEH